jgi:tetratricopeptide (TPR) repeat protein
MSVWVDILKSAVPGVVEWPTLSLGEKIGETIKLLLELGGLWEALKYCYRWIFRRRSRIELENELLTQDRNEKKKEIGRLQAEKAQLAAELAGARRRLPESAISEAEREWRDHNDSSAVRILEEWFKVNAKSVSDMALKVAKFHISHSIPDPRQHLHVASNMLRVAQEVSPENQEARELWGEWDVLNASLQEQIIRHGDTQIAWNSGMSERLREKGEALLPIVQTLHDVAQVCFIEGRWQLAPIFADRAAILAESGGPPLRRVWFGVETIAAWYSSLAGHATEALRRLNRALAEGGRFLDARELSMLRARHFRAAVLRELGRYDDALKEIDAFAPIQVEVIGARHPDVLTTRYLRADVLRDLGRYAEALKEIDAFAPIQVEVIGARHPDVLTTRYLRANVLRNLGRDDEALKEIDAVTPIEVEVKGARHPDVLTTRAVRAYVLRNLGRYAEALKEIDAFTPIQVEVKGARHPDVLTTRAWRAAVLQDLGRYDEALEEIDAFTPIQVEVKGARHPDVLTTGAARANVLQDLGRYDEALEEIDAFTPIQVEVIGTRHPNVLTTRYLRASVLQNLGRYDEVLKEIDAFAPIEVEVKGARHPDVLATRSLRIGMDIAARKNVDSEPELRSIIKLLAGSPSKITTLRTRYRLARLLFQSGRIQEAREEISDVIAHFDVATAPNHVVLRAAKTLQKMIDGEPTDDALIT